MLGKPLYEAGMVSREVVVRSVAAQMEFLLFGSDARKLDRAKEGILALTKGWRQDDVDRIVSEAVEQRIAPFIHLPVRRLADAHRREGRRVYLVSSSPEEVVRPLADYLGIEHVIATRAEVRDGVYTGNLDFYCFGEAKVDAMQAQAREHDLDLAASYAYSDSASDVPMLRAVGHAVAVDPDKELRRTAEAEGWEIIEAPSNRAVYASLGAAAGVIGAVWSFGYARGKWKIRRAKKEEERRARKKRRRPW